jgi:predicted dehydrogenase
MMVKKIGVAVVGLHNWYHAYPFGLAVKHVPDVKLVAAAHDDESQLKQYSDYFGLKQYSTNMESVIRRKDVDAVIITANTAAHAKLAKIACEEGKHILCDKPLEASLEKAHEMIRSVEKASVKFEIAFGFRNEPDFRKTIEIAESGAIGKIVSFYFSVNSPIPGGWITTREPGWYADQQKSGGGGFLDHAVSEFDGLRLAVKKEAKKVSGMVGNLIYKNMNVEDYGVAFVEFSENLKGVVQASWISVPPAGYCETYALYGTDGNVALVGEKILLNGRILKGVLGKTEISMSPENFEIFRAIPGLVEYPIDEWYQLLVPFIEGIREDKNPPQTIYDGLKSLELCLATYESYRKQKTIDMNEFNKTR